MSWQHTEPPNTVVNPERPLWGFPLPRKLFRYITVNMPHTWRFPSHHHYQQCYVHPPPQLIIGVQHTLISACPGEFSLGFPASGSQHVVEDSISQVIFRSHSPFKVFEAFPWRTQTVAAPPHGSLAWPSWLQLPRAWACQKHLLHSHFLSGTVVVSSTSSSTTVTTYNRAPPLARCAVTPSDIPLSSFQDCRCTRTREPVPICHGWVELSTISPGPRLSHTDGIFSTPPGPLPWPAFSQGALQRVFVPQKWISVLRASYKAVKSFSITRTRLCVELMIKRIFKKPFYWRMRN